MNQKYSIIPDYEHMGDSLKLSKEYQAPFEYNDFVMGPCLWDGECRKARVAFYRSLDRDRSQDTMHGAFYEVIVHSMDPLVRQISRRRVEESLQTARDLGLKGVVFHTNVTPEICVGAYRHYWRDVNEEFWRQMLEKFPGVEIYMENMFDREPDTYVELAERMKDQENFGLCLDYAHAMLYGNDIESWVQAVAPYVRHLHINDNRLQYDDHLPVGEGLIDWQQFMDLTEKYLPPTSCLIEVNGCAAQRASFEKLQSFILLRNGKESQVQQ
ncbi:MAG: sugar phosphate isomerase/epimerase [Lachnospiraceae bacterium]|nr:sugar phosphate isomerase/epimerase [Lachnospiraceae bacterium]